VVVLLTTEGIRCAIERTRRKLGTGWRRGLVLGVCLAASAGLNARELFQRIPASPSLAPDRMASAIAGEALQAAGQGRNVLISALFGKDILVMKTRMNRHIRYRLPFDWNRSAVESALLAPGPTTILSDGGATAFPLVSLLGSSSCVERSSVHEVDRYDLSETCEQEVLQRIGSTFSEDSR